VNPISISSSGPGEGQLDKGAYVGRFNVGRVEGFCDALLWGKPYLQPPCDLTLGSEIRTQEYIAFLVLLINVHGSVAQLKTEGWIIHRDI